MQQDSWGSEKLLKLILLALQFCKSIIGNGLTTRYWFDVWTPLGQLTTYIGARRPRALRLRRNLVVADAINDSNWNMSHLRSQQEVDLHFFLTTISLLLLHDIDDGYEWIAGNSSSCVYSSSATLNALRPRQEIQDWHDVVCFKGSVPKHSLQCGL